MKNIFQKVLKKRLFLFRSLVGFLLLLCFVSPIKAHASNPLTDFGTSLWNSYNSYDIAPLSNLISSVFYVLPKPKIIPPIPTTTTKVVSKPPTTTPPKTTTTIVKNDSPITYVTNNYPTTTIYQTTGLDTSSFVSQGQFNNPGEYNGRNIQALHDELSNSFNTNTLIVRNQATVSGDLTVTGSTTFNTVPYTWPNLQGVAGSILQNDGTGALTWATLGAASVTPDSLDFSEFKDALTLDASTDIAASGTNVLSITNTGTGNSFVVNDQASDSSPFVIDASGNVGIGTITPTQALDVTGKIAVNGTALIYLPDQTNFLGTVYVGSNGGGSLLHSSSTQGQQNTFVGISAGSASTTALNNTGIGYQAPRCKYYRI